MSTQPSTLTTAAVVFDPGINLIPANLAKYNVAYRASLSPSRLAYMALPYNDADPNWKPGMATRCDPAQMASQAAQSPLDIQIQVWGDDPCRTMNSRWLQGYPNWVPSFGMASFVENPGVTQPLVTQNYSESGPPPAGAILVPALNADGTFVLPTPYPVPASTVPVPNVNAVIGMFQMRAMNPADGLMHNWYAVQFGDITPVGTVDKTGLYQKADLFTGQTSEAGLGPSTLIMWENILPVPSAAI